MKREEASGRSASLLNQRCEGLPDTLAQKHRDLRGKRQHYKFRGRSTRLVNELPERSCQTALPF